jgi:hypothetical protein
MTLSDLASVGSLVSGVAVLASLIYLSLQARHNTASFHRKARSWRLEECLPPLQREQCGDLCATLFRRSLRST